MGQARRAAIHARQDHRIFRSLLLRTCLVDRFPACWIGNRGQNRPSRTLDLTPCKLFCASGQKESGAVQNAARNGFTSAAVALSFVTDNI